MTSRRLFVVTTLLSTLLLSAAFARDLTDAMGSAVVPDAPKRIVVLTFEGPEGLRALGVVPVGKESAINLELVAALGPDLILGNKQRHEEIHPQLTAIAPTVFTEELRGDWKVNFRLYAEALGMMEQAEEVIADYDAAVSDLASALGDSLSEQVSVIRFLPGQIRIYHLDSFSGVLLQDIGFDRPEKQNVPDFAIRTGKESIPDMDGDRIYWFTWETGDGEGDSLADDILSDPLWQSLSAVKAGRVHGVGDAIWNTAGGILAARLMLVDGARIYGVE